MKVAAIALALALAGAAAHAQQAQDRQAIQGSAQPMGEGHFSNVIGTTVRTQAGNELGTISDVVMRDGQLVAVIDVGEDLAAMGVDKKRIALDWRSLSPAPGGDELVAGVTMGELAATPEFLGEPTPPATRLGD